MEMVNISCCTYSLLGAVPVTCVPVGSFPPMGMNDVAFIPISQIKRQRSREAKACFLWSQNQQVGTAGTKIQPSALPTLLLTCHTPATAPSGAATACPPPTGFIFSMSQWVLHENTSVYSQCKKQHKSACQRGIENTRQKEGWEAAWPQVHGRPNDLRESCTRSVATKEKARRCVYFLVSHKK